MAKEKSKNIADLSDDELVAEITAHTETLFKYRFQLATGQLENPMKMRGVRKQIARLKPAQRMRELKSGAGASA